MASVNTQFSIAVHLLTTLAIKESLTSEQLAGSVNTNASFVRRLLSKLAKAGLVQTARGKGGACRLARKSKDIPLSEIYSAVDAPKVFAIHRYKENKSCLISCSIKSALNDVLEESQALVEKNLRGISLFEIVTSLEGVSSN